MYSVSYSVGLLTGIRMKTEPNGSDIDKYLYMQGFANGVDSTSILIDQKEADKIVRTYFQKKQLEVRKKMEEDQAKKAETTHADYKKANEEFLAANKSKEGVVTTDSGLQYQVLKEGSGESPKATDKVRVHYHGTLSDGTIFDSSVDRGQPSEFRLNQVIKGWTEGLQLMKKGAKYKFFIPQELAYGHRPSGKVKPFSALTFEVELLDINPK